ncbi:amino acid-binding protein [Methanobacterium alkalithermotolerans]|uniref:Amino acid-binding protein n=1 Tax=Methanobacterium alkalithermotolerans TaxID=2731220 RepID=A0A8T8KAQ4_9EURY|nr:ACT domain-containing protein [Methanobacterium alkalithermotolerans]QUH22491.1 amino acid-binding protein [Methanobacterium alkalithermotolerans]RJS49423.1 MAG: amino acid-binding protein [Methanobacterium sp.]
MRTNLVLELQDVPGQLVGVLGPIGTLGANIVTVIHQRDIKTDKGMVPVQITIEGDQNTLDVVLKKLEELNIQVMAVDGIVLKEKITTLLIGNIVDRDVKDTMDNINSLEGVRVADLELKLSENNQDSSAKIVVEAEYGNRDIFIDKIEEIADIKDFKVINEV